MEDQEILLRDVQDALASANVHLQQLLAPTLAHTHTLSPTREEEYIDSGGRAPEKTDHDAIEAEKACIDIMNNGRLLAGVQAQLREALAHLPSNTHAHAHTHTHKEAAHSTMQSRLLAASALVSAYSTLTHTYDACVALGQDIDAGRYEAALQALAKLEVELSAVSTASLASEEMKEHVGTLSRTLARRRTAVRAAVKDCLARALVATSTSRPTLTMHASVPLVVAPGLIDAHATKPHMEVGMLLAIARRLGEDVFEDVCEQWAARLHAVLVTPLLSTGGMLAADATGQLPMDTPVTCAILEHNAGDGSTTVDDDGRLRDSDTRIGAASTTAYLQMVTPAPWCEAGAARGASATTPPPHYVHTIAQLQKLMDFISEYFLDLKSQCATVSSEPSVSSSLERAEMLMKRKIWYGLAQAEGAADISSDKLVSAFKSASEDPMAATSAVLLELCEGDGLRACVARMLVAALPAGWASVHAYKEALLAPSVQLENAVACSNDLEYSAALATVQTNFLDCFCWKRQVHVAAAYSRWIVREYGNTVEVDDERDPCSLTPILRSTLSELAAEAVRIVPSEAATAGPTAVSVATSLVELAVGGRIHVPVGVLTGTTELGEAAEGIATSAMKQVDSVTGLQEGRDFDAFLFRMPTCRVSDIAFNIGEIIRATVQQAASVASEGHRRPLPSTTSPSHPKSEDDATTDMDHSTANAIAHALLVSVRDAVDAFMLVAPTKVPKDDQAAIVRLGMLLHNDCAYLAHVCVSAGLVHKPALSGDLSVLSSFVDVINPLRELAQRAFVSALYAARSGVQSIVQKSPSIFEVSTLDERDDETGLFERLLEATRAQRRAVRDTAMAWRSLLPPRLFDVAVGKLLDTCYDSIYTRVLECSMITEDASRKLSDILADELGWAELLADLGDGVSDPDVDASGLADALKGHAPPFAAETQQDAVALAYIPSWQRLKLLRWMLGEKLVEIADVFDNQLAHRIMPVHHAVSIICALFQQSSNRDAVISRLERQRSATATASA